MGCSRKANSFEMILVGRVLYGFNAALQKLWGRKDFKAEIEEMLEEQAAIKGEKPKSVWELLRDRSLRWQLITMVVTLTAIQFCGVSIISSYAFEVFRETGIPDLKIRYVTLGVGATEVFTSITCDTISWLPYFNIFLIFIFVMFYGLGPASVILPLCLEIFIQSSRPAAFVFTGILKWTEFAVIGMAFPFLLVYKQDCETFGIVVKMLIAKDPSLEQSVQFSLQENLKEIGFRIWSLAENQYLETGLLFKKNERAEKDKHNQQDRQHTFNARDTCPETKAEGPHELQQDALIAPRTEVQGPHQLQDSSTGS
ncbi:UNVERIFIED_CONTAM: hypothetical protein FKN15_002620 [Acipenser sinensis]